MTLINEHEGTEEWLCSTCGRHMLISWHPGFKRTILVDGDPSAPHSGFKNDLLLDEVQDTRLAVPVDKNIRREDVPQPIDDPRLTPWMAWMDEVGFENLWHKNGQ